jgi:hypothetical protein
MGAFKAQPSVSIMHDVSVTALTGNMASAERNDGHIKKSRRMNPALAMMMK